MEHVRHPASGCRQPEPGWRRGRGPSRLDVPHRRSSCRLGTARDAPRDGEDTIAALTVIAKLKAKAGSEEALFALLEGLVAPTYAEKGCIAYELHRSHDDPGLFMFTESWESRPLWEDHMKSPHLASFGETSPGLTETWELFTGEKV